MENSVKGIIKSIYKLIPKFLLTRIIHCKNFIVHPNAKLPLLIPYVPNGKYKATHFSAFSYGNAGDVLLPIVLRDLFNLKIGVKKWYGIHVHTNVDNGMIRFINKDDFLVVGGGGLFLKDTGANNNSGWQWNCSIKKLKSIHKPIVAFAIGYNRFRGQEEFNPIFTEHLNVFVQKAVFVGIRNHGSIERLKDYLENEELKNKLVFQPCMTTLISHIYPNYTDYSIKEDFIAFNCAFDRSNLRSLSEDCLSSIARVAFLMSKQTKIKYFSHMPTDKAALKFFDKYKVPYELVELRNPHDIVDFYSKARLVVGMRGHSQMIPFGCLTPIVSIISHDKMLWFLEDINHPEWGVDVLDNHFEEELFEKTKKAYVEFNKRIDIIKVEQERLWTVTANNLDIINQKINCYKNERTKDYS